MPQDQPRLSRQPSAVNATHAIPPLDVYTPAVTPSGSRVQIRAARAAGVNHLVDGLPRAERQRLLAGCTATELVFGDVLCEAGEPLRRVYFPIAGFISLVQPMAGHKPLELGLVGSEGVVGATLALGVATVPVRAVVQGAGSCLQVSVARLRRELQGSPGLAQSLRRFLYVTMLQLSRVAACTCFHEIEPRLARWLLMTHDRAPTDRLHLNHQFLADMLGVRRSAVTIAAGALRRRGVIRYARGEITVTSRSGLEAASCECYALMLQDYTSQFS